MVPVLLLFHTATVNRSMAVTIPYRMSGSTLRRAPVGFTDVVSGTYYAVGWAQRCKWRYDYQLRPYPWCNQ